MSDRRGFEWFPFYVSRFLSSRRVRRMDAREVGIYMLLLCEQWEHGAVLDDDAELALIGRRPADEVRAVLRMCFRLTDGSWINDRLEAIRAQQIAKAEKASKAAEARWSASERNADALPIEEEGEVERDRDLASTSSVTAQAVADFCLMTGSTWKLKRVGIPQWAAELESEGRYIGLDLAFEIKKCWEWHSGKNRRPAPHSAIRNWLDKARVPPARPQLKVVNGNPSQSLPRQPRSTHPVEE